MREIQHADPVARRRALIAIAVITVAGWVAFFVLQDWLMGMQGASPDQARKALEDAMIWGSWAASLPVFALAVWLWLLGGRIYRAGRFPAPGSKVIRDTPVLHGDAARVRGTLLRVLAVLLSLVCAGTLIACYRLIAVLEG